MLAPGSPLAHDAIPPRMGSAVNRRPKGRNQWGCSRVTFENDTFIVLDLPEPYASAIMDVRVRHRDTVRMAMPVEVTIAGSGGVGVLEREQDRASVFGVLDEIAKETAPIDSRFGPVIHWPPSLFVMSWEDEAPFHALHERLVRSPIRFGQSPFPFNPHTTLRSRPGITDDEQTELMSFRAPGEITLLTMSVFEGGPGDPVWVRLLHRVPLTGPQR